ncbi:GTPase IMAP family member 8-like [Centropristis striata]|uniref:GTPase IMAP family member 8-like n=1 Tax=Centropristis striata TaxID=184440 RepID=UPI0027DFD1EE|nr:GTPase IMAP family member 8-like [Centropristis striata]
MEPALNMVLCGRRGAGKTSAAKAILGETELHSVSSSECVKHQGEVCGRWVSLVELPALNGKPQEEVMEESLRCISLCDPEGVHAFILVLPVGPLTDEDKGELETIQNTFSSRVNDFTMILFTESDPPATDVVNNLRQNKDIQQFLQSSGGKYIILNIRDQKQIPQLLDAVEKPCCYTTATFANSQIKKIIQQEKCINMQQAELQMLKNSTCLTGDEEHQSPECLRIVLIGKTGCGKSSSGNTILGRKEFKAESSQKSVTKECQKAQSEVDGRPVVVVDTPGLFDTNLSHEEVNEEMVRCISLLAPGPHVFLLVIKIDRFTSVDKEALKLIKEGFGKNAEKFTIILLTGGDSLEHEKIPVKNYIQEKSDDSFKKLISDCGGRYHVFNNYNEQNHKQVSELVTKINTMVKENGGSCYTNEMLQKAEAAIQKEMEKILKEKEEEMQREKEELQRKHERKLQEMKRRMEEQGVKIENERKQREKQLQEYMSNELNKRKKEQERREKEELERKRQEELQRLGWQKKIEAMEIQIKQESESKETIDRELKQKTKLMKEKQEAWERERKEWWEKRDQDNEKRQQEECTIIKGLKEEQEIYEKNIKEQDVIQREREEKEQKELEENYKKSLVRIKEEFEEEARKKAEEFNTYGEKCKKELKEREEEIKAEKEHYENLKAQSAQSEEKMSKKHQERINDLVRCVSKKRKNVKKISALLKKQEQEMNNVGNQMEKENLQKTHDKQLSELIRELLEDKSPCPIS